MFASVIALLIALSQWARWGGFIEWDLLSAASGLAQSAQVKLAALPSGNASSFNCPNLALDPQSPIFSDAQLKAVGHEICNVTTAEALLLRGTDGSFADPRRAAAQRANRQGRRRVAVVSDVAEKASAARGFTVANFEPQRTGNTHEILDEVERSVRTLDAIDPCELNPRSCDPGSTPDSPRPNDNDDYDGSGKEDDDHDGDGHDKDYSDNDSDGGHDDNDSGHDDNDSNESYGDDDSGDDHDGSYDVAENGRDGDDHDVDSHGSDDRDGDSQSGGDRDDRDGDNSGSSGHN